MQTLHTKCTTSPMKGKIESSCQSQAIDFDRVQVADERIQSDQKKRTNGHNNNKHSQSSHNQLRFTQVDKQLQHNRTWFCGDLGEQSCTWFLLCLPNGRMQKNKNLAQLRMMLRHRPSALIFSLQAFARRPSPDGRRCSSLQEK